MNLDTNTMTLEQAKAAIWQLQRGAHRDATTLDSYYDSIARHQVTNGQLQREVQRLSQELTASRNLRASLNPIDLEANDHGDATPAALRTPRASVAAPSAERLKDRNEEQVKNEKRLQAKNEELRHQAISLREDLQKAWNKAGKLNDRIEQLDSERFDMGERMEKLEADLRTAKAAKAEPNLGRSVFATPMSPRKTLSSIEAAKQLLDAVQGDASKAVNLVYAQSRSRGFKSNSISAPDGDSRPREHQLQQSRRAASPQHAAPVSQHDTLLAEHTVPYSQRATIGRYKPEQFEVVPPISNIRGCENPGDVTAEEKRLHRMRKSVSYGEDKKRAFAVDLTSDDDTEQPKKKARQTQATSPSSESKPRKLISAKMRRKSVADRAAHPSIPAEARVRLAQGHTSRFKAIVRELKGCKPYKEFILPVDPEADECPDYPEVIESPCSLQVIEGKLDNQQYATLEDVDADFRLIVYNATTYNPPEHETFQNAERFEKEYRRLLDGAGLMQLSRGLSMGTARRRTWLFERTADLYD